MESKESMLMIAESRFKELLNYERLFKSMNELNGVVIMKTMPSYSGETEYHFATKSEYLAELDDLNKRYTKRLVDAQQQVIGFANHLTNKYGYFISKYIEVVKNPFYSIMFKPKKNEVITAINTFNDIKEAFSIYIDKSKI